MFIGSVKQSKIALRQECHVHRPQTTAAGIDQYGTPKGALDLVLPLPINMAPLRGEHAAST